MSFVCSMALFFQICVCVCVCRPVSAWRNIRPSGRIQQNQVRERERELRWESLRNERMEVRDSGKERFKGLSYPHSKTKEELRRWLFTWGGRRRGERQVGKLGKIMSLERWRIYMRKMWEIRRGKLWWRKSRKWQRDYEVLRRMAIRWWVSEYSA